MKAQLNRDQGRLVRAIGIYLSKVSIPPADDAKYRMIVEAIHSTPWASLTFAGERHHLVLRLPGSTYAPDRIDASALAVPGRIVAIESETRSRAAGDTVLTLDLLTLNDGE